MSEGMGVLVYLGGVAVTCGCLAAWCAYRGDNFMDTPLPLFASVFWPVGLPAFVAYVGGSWLGNSLREWGQERRRIADIRSRELAAMEREVDKILEAR